jgi:hypothetical protein
MRTIEDIDDLILSLERSRRRAHRLWKRSLDRNYRIGIHVYSGRLSAYAEAIRLCKELKKNY